MIKYREGFEALKRLKDRGYSQDRIRRDKLIGQATLTQLRHGELVSWKTIDTICALLDCQPGDFLEYVPDPIAQDLPQGERSGVQNGGGSPLSTEKK